MSEPKASYSTEPTPLRPPLTRVSTGTGVLLRPRDIEQQTGLSHAAVWRLLNTPATRGGIPCIRIGRSVRVRQADFQRWLDGLSVSNP